MAISYYQANYNVSTQGSVSVSGVSWGTGDIIVVGGLTEGSTGSDTISTPTATGLVFSPIVAVPPNSACFAGLWSATATSPGSSVTVSANKSAPLSQYSGLSVWVFPGASGVGNHTSGNTTAATAALTPTQAHSAIVWLVGDWNAGSIGSEVPTPTDNRAAGTVSGRYSYYVADLTDQPSTGSTSYGITGQGGSGPYSIVAVEVVLTSTTPLTKSVSDTISMTDAITSSLATNEAVFMPSDWVIF